MPEKRPVIPQPSSLLQARPWDRHEGVTVVECPSCGFRMDADHEDMEGGYSCPNCQVTELFTALKEARG